MCVVVGHIAHGYIVSNQYPGSWNFWYTIDNVIYSFHMALFFTISGYVYNKAYLNVDGVPRYNKLWIQVLNLVVIYVVFSVGFTLVKIPFNAISNEQASFSDILWMWKNPVGVYWYLYVLIEMYLVFSIPCVTKLKFYIIVPVCIGLSVLSYYISFPFHIPALLYYLVFFALGVTYARNKKIISNMPLAVCGFLLSISLSIAFWNKNVKLNSIHYVNLVLAFGYTCFIWFIFEHINLIGNSKTLRFLGSRSLEIYVIHGPVITAGRVLMNRLGSENQYLCLVILMCLGAGIPLLFSFVTRKIGLFDWLFKFASMTNQKIKSKTA